MSGGHHNWSGWPGAFCLDCGADSPLDDCIANHQQEINGEGNPERCLEPEKHGPPLGPCPGRPTGTSPDRRK